MCARILFFVTVPSFSELKATHHFSHSRLTYWPWTSFKFVLSCLAGFEFFWVSRNNLQVEAKAGNWFWLRWDITIANTSVGSSSSPCFIRDIRMRTSVSSFKALSVQRRASEAERFFHWQSTSIKFSKSNACRVLNPAFRIQICMLISPLFVAQFSVHRM